MNTRTEAKYRPSLKESHILHMIDLARKEEPISKESLEILGILTPFAAKISNDAINPAYITDPKPNIMESLGGGGESLHNGLSKEGYWKVCYEKCRDYPETCTAREFQAANEHRYLNDLMTPEEIIEFEKDL